MTRSLIAMGVAAAVLLPFAAEAQVDAQSSAWTDLSKVLKPGEELTVVDDKGERTTGRLADLSSSTLTLQVPGKAPRFLISDVPVPPEQRQFALGTVTRIDRRDSLKEGAWGGLAVALGLSLYTGRVCDSEDFCDALAVLTLSSLVAGPVIGALIDHSITTPIYRAPNGRLTASLGLSPRLQRKGGVLSVKLAF